MILRVNVSVSTSSKAMVSSLIGNLTQDSLSCGRNVNTWSMDPKPGCRAGVCVCVCVWGGGGGGGGGEGGDFSDTHLVVPTILTQLRISIANVHLH